MSEDQVQAIYDEFEDEFYISGFINDNEFRKLIRQWNGDKNKLKEYIEEKM